MRKKSRLNILYIEDQQQDYENLQMDAIPHSIRLYHETNLEDGIEHFTRKGESFFDGIIIDAICMLNKNSSTAKEAHLFEALSQFDKLAPNLLKVIYTGEPSVMKWVQNDKFPLFNKGNYEDVQNMLTMLVESSKTKEDRKFTQKYQDAFVTIEEYMQPDAYGRMLFCVRNMTNTDTTAITGILSNLRKMQEYLYVALNRIDKNMVPDHLLVGDSGNTNINNKRIIEHLKGNFDRTSGRITTAEYVKHNSKEDRLLNYVYRGCSEEIHVTDQDTNRYTVQSLVFAFMDLLTWLRKIGDSQNDIRA